MVRATSITFAAWAMLSASAASAAIVEANLDLSFHQRASLGAAIDATLMLDPVAAAQRLVNERLGIWSGTTLEFIGVQHSVGAAMNDPGQNPPSTVHRPPSTELRDLLRVRTTGRLDGDLLAGIPVISAISQRYGCPAGVTACSTATVLSSSNLSAPVAGLTSPTQALGSLRIQAEAAQTEILFPGTTLRLGAVPAPPTVPINFDQSYHELQGILRLRANYQSKEVVQYMADALTATVPAAPAVWATRLSNATADIATLRAGNYQTAAVQSGRTAVTAVAELMEAHAGLAAARDAASWQAQGASAGGSLSTRSELVNNLWNLGATAAPDLSRQRAAFADEPHFFRDLRNEVAAVRAGLGSSDDLSFQSQLAQYTGSAVSSSEPFFTLDGAGFGLEGALIQVFFTEGSSDGAFAVQLPAAARHAMWKPSSVDKLTLIGGPVDGIEVDGWGLLTVGDDSVYVGEDENLRLFSGGDALELGLNNLYTSRSLVFASWGVAAPVPEPAAAWLLVAGTTLVGWRARRVRLSRGSGQTLAA